MTEPVTIEQYQEAYYQIRQYEFQQLPPGRSLLRLLYVVDVPTLLRHEIESLLAYGVNKKIILFSSAREVSDVYFTAYFDAEDLLNAYSWWGHTFGPKSVDTLTRAFKKSNCTFGTTIETPLPMPHLVNTHRHRDQESRAQVATVNIPTALLWQQPLEPDNMSIQARPSVIDLAQYKQAIDRYRAYEEQRRGPGRPLLDVLRNANASARVCNAVFYVLHDFIKEQLIPFTYSGDVTDVFFVSYFTGEDLLKIRNFGLNALKEFKQIMAKNDLLFK
ncbi:hypothetical protein SAMN05216464_1451 [Mucilaginibacter pineti]|uniref:Uncharacterized protein n=1 Tax=Mucilaginibacter pineti TaxID=1391627 RepID=A0A1G7PDN2_9SPHI|nr:hypothetical protein [Mucilaginibacter pineti]SDF84257.1 hypothetical protein SAMN05216464_1451 [Mucilaginibacter pineti]